MTIPEADIFSVAEQRLAWTGERQAVLARDIANISTPGFVAQDVAPFQTVLAGQTGVRLEQTDPGHMAGTIDAGGAGRVQVRDAARTADKNAVRLEDQVTKVADTEAMYASVTAIYKKYMTMFDTALGKGS